MEEFAPKALNILLADLQEPAADLFVECIPAANPPQPGSPPNPLAKSFLSSNRMAARKSLFRLEIFPRSRRTPTARQVVYWLNGW